MLQVWKKPTKRRENQVNMANNRQSAHQLDYMEEDGEDEADSVAEMQGEAQNDDTQDGNLDEYDMVGLLN